MKALKLTSTANVTDSANEDGQAMVEYALILALITVVSVTFLTQMGASLQGLLEATGDVLAGIAAGL
jgi:Flp pilus assembly pilin Flp